MGASFVAGDTGSVYRVTCKNSDGTLIDLNGKTVTLCWIDEDGDEVSRSMTIIDADNAIAEYQFQSGELYSPEMRFQVRITDGSGDFIRNVAPLTEIVAPAIC